MTDWQPLVGKQALAVHHSTARINFYDGSVRSSKTGTSLVDWIRYCRRAPAGPLLMTGRTERTVLNNLVEPLMEMLGTGRVSINQGNGTVTICGRKVLIVGANNEAARTKIQGLTLAGSYSDEVPTMPESYWNMLVSRHSVPGAQMFATGNPEGPRHWAKRLWLDRAKLWIDHDGQIHDRTTDFERLEDGDPDRPLNLHRFSFTLDDNPALDPQVVSDLKNSYTGVWYQRFIRGQWVGAEGAVYDCWDPAKHVIPWSSLPKMTKILGTGVDYGTTNPTVGIMLGIGVDRRLYLIDEWRYAPRTDAERRSDPKLSLGFREWLAQDHLPYRNAREHGNVVVDPAAASFRVQLRDDGQETDPAENDVVYGIRTVHSLLATGNLLVSDRCRGFIGEAPEYRWDPKATEQGQDAPIKIDDHSADAVRYIVTTTERIWRQYVNLTNLAQAA
ncbi:PBSX family phage terminase large subunit [Nocardia sp. NPDC088792]|uniref:PBSX family phage terminase large subunit n=1 Tax=Nocardia sp. NPDC088792 TaxID=3364332 RepID=UPI003815CE54